MIYYKNHILFQVRTEILLINSYAFEEKLIQVRA